MRQIIPDDVTVIALNVGAVAAAAVAVYLPSRRLGLSGLALAGIAAFVLSGPVLYFASEGRSYTIALSIVFGCAARLARNNGFPDELNLTRSILLGCLAALTHVYAALFWRISRGGFGGSAAFSGRKDLLKPGLALGVSASIVFGIWLSIAFYTVDNLSWLEFTVSWVLNAALSVKELALGANFQVVVVIALFVFVFLMSGHGHFLLLFLLRSCFLRCCR